MPKSVIVAADVQRYPHCYRPLPTSPSKPIGKKCQQQSTGGIAVELDPYAVEDRNFLAACRIAVEQGNPAVAVAVVRVWDQMRKWRGNSAVKPALGSPLKVGLCGNCWRRHKMVAQNMFRIVLECDCAGLSVSDGFQAATDITEEFTHRPWHRNVTCTWNGRSLKLEADNDFDENGLALCDEFSDAICACVSIPNDDGNLRIVSVSEVD